LLLFEFVPLPIRNTELLKRWALNPLLSIVGLGELGTGPGPGLINRAGAMFIQKWTRLLGSRYRVRDVEAAFLGVGVVNVSNLSQDV